MIRKFSILKQFIETSDFERMRADFPILEGDTCVEVAVSQQLTDSEIKVRILGENNDPS